MPKDNCQCPICNCTENCSCECCCADEDSAEYQDNLGFGDEEEGE